MNSRGQAQCWIDELPRGGGRGQRQTRMGGGGGVLAPESNYIPHFGGEETHRGRGQKYLAQAHSKTTVHLITNNTRRMSTGSAEGPAVITHWAHVSLGCSAHVLHYSLLQWRKRRRKEGGGGGGGRETLTGPSRLEY